MFCVVRSGSRPARRLYCRWPAEREWDQFHTPRNLALALVGEVGELCEIFQWKGELSPGVPGAGLAHTARAGAVRPCGARVPAELTEAERVHLGEEMSDILLYLTRLAGTLQWCLPLPHTQTSRHTPCPSVPSSPCLQPYLRAVCARPV